jgi:hypothetical protein
MLTAYFDESGTSQNNLVAGVAGYIGSSFQWEKFNIAWKKMLLDFGLSEFHRTDIESKHLHTPGWTTEDRTKVVRKAHAIIKDHTYIGVGNAVIKQDFADLFPQSLKKFFRGPYGFCAFCCVARTKNWHDKLKSVSNINWVFEAGADGAGEFNTLMKAIHADPVLREEYKVGSWSFAVKEVLPLQAADTIAYELFKFVQGQMVENRGKPRLSFRDLVREKEHLEFWSREQLQEYLESDGMRDLTQAATNHRFLDYIRRSR